MDHVKVNQLQAGIRISEGSVMSVPSVTVKSHDNAFYAATIFRIGTFREHVVNLLFCRIETQIADLQDTNTTM